MSTERDLTILKNIVRIGTVSSVDIPSRTARVVFRDKQDADGRPLVSGQLKVLKNPPFIPYVNMRQETEAKGGGSGDAAFESHKHDVIITPWLPAVGDLVLCLYLPQGESDGFVVGGI